MRIYFIIDWALYRATANDHQLLFGCNSYRTAGVSVLYVIWILNSIIYRIIVFIICIILLYN